MALTKEQLLARRDKIGGSDAAAICGRDPYRTAYEVALRIRGEIEPDLALDDADQILFGNEMEEVLARIYARKHGAVLGIPEARIHPDNPRIAVNIDRRILNRPEVGIECKNTGLRYGAAPADETWGKPGTDEVPIRVILQCQHGMMVCPEIQTFHVLRCFGGNVFQQFVVPRSQALIDDLYQIEAQFLSRVLLGDLPEPDWLHSTTSTVLRRAFRRIEGTVETRPDLEHWTKCWEDSALVLKEAKKLEESLKNRICHMMGAAEVAVLSDGRKWRRAMRSRAAYSVEETEYIETKLLKPRKRGEENGD